MSTTDRGANQAANVWMDAQRSEDFARLRKRLRGFVFPTAVGFLVWYELYVLLAAFAPGFMATPVIGNINVGLIFGLLQFVTTFLITIWYVRFADRVLDPVSDKIRRQLEGDLR